MANKSKYRELLDYCDKYKLSIYDMNIASEVEFAFKDSGGRDRDDFDALCDLTSDVYLHVDSDVSLLKSVFYFKSFHFKSSLY